MPGRTSLTTRKLVLVPQIVRPFTALCGVPAHPTLQNAHEIPELLPSLEISRLSPHPRSSSRLPPLPSSPVSRYAAVLAASGTDVSLILRVLAYWGERPELFTAIANAKSDEDRSIAVLRWFIVRCATCLCRTGVHR